MLPDSNARLEDRIADLVLAKFNSLPEKNKPSVNGDGIRNWAPLSGIVLSDGK